MATTTSISYFGAVLIVLLGSNGCARNGLTPQELSLQQHLGVLRQVLSQFESDQGKNPASLDALIAAGYLRILPYDPITRSNQSWIVTTEDAPGSRHRGVVGVRSGARGTASDGTRYLDW